MNSADSCIRNYINGNLTDAKQQAKRVKAIVIYQALRARFGKAEGEALAICRYLKSPTNETFQEACKAELVGPPGDLPNDWESCSTEQLRWLETNGFYGQRLAARYQLSKREAKS